MVVGGLIISMFMYVFLPQTVEPSHETDSDPSDSDRTVEFEDAKGSTALSDDDGLASVSGNEDSTERHSTDEEAEEEVDNGEPSVSCQGSFLALLAILCLPQCRGCWQSSAMTTGQLKDVYQSDLPVDLIASVLSS